MKQAYAEFLNSDDEVRVVSDTAGRLLAVNRKFCELLERPETDVVGTYFWDFIDPVSLGAALHELDRLSLGEDLHSLKTRYIAASGRRFGLEWSAPGVGDDDLIIARARVLPLAEVPGDAA